MWIVHFFIANTSTSNVLCRRSRYQSTRQRSHYRFLASRSRSHSHSPLRTKTRSRSQSPHKQKLKHRSARRSTPQSPSRKWSRSRSPRHNSSSRHHSRSQSPKLRRWATYCTYLLDRKFCVFVCTCTSATEFWQKWTIHSLIPRALPHLSLLL